VTYLALLVWRHYHNLQVYWPVLPQLEEVEPSNVEKAFHLMSKWKHIALNCKIYLLSSPFDLLNRKLGILLVNKNFCNYDYKDWEVSLDIFDIDMVINKIIKLLEN
jgi:hypothetical protein